ADRVDKDVRAVHRREGVRADVFLLGEALRERVDGRLGVRVLVRVRRGDGAVEVRGVVGRVLYALRVHPTVRDKVRSIQDALHLGARDADLGTTRGAGVDRLRAFVLGVGEEGLPVVGGLRVEVLPENDRATLLGDLRRELVCDALTDGLVVRPDRDLRELERIDDEVRRGRPLERIGCSHAEVVVDTVGPELRRR